jgi:MHS family proline/betaine transporter-like MFS transporter
MDSKKSDWILILAVSVGGFLEWYEIGLYIYWPLIILGDMSNLEIPAAEAINTGLVLATGFFARTLGGWLFGRWGDRKGRKIPFTWSIAMVALPSLLIVFLPSYIVWSVFSTILFTSIKFIQGIPAGGELPGAICFLAENGRFNKRKYLCSYTFVGPQFGLLFSMAICLILQLAFTQRELMEFWWRLIFLTSGIIGILGLYLRNKLHESTEFESLKHHKHILKSPIHELFKTHSRTVFLGIGISVFQVVSFCILTILPSELYKDIFKLNAFQNFTVNSLSLLACALAPPFIGKFSSFFNKIPLFSISAYGVLILSYPFYSAIIANNLAYTLILHSIMIALYSIQAALLPSLLADIFPTRMRYTGIGFSFNVCDGVLWGIIPILSSLLMQKTGNSGSFIIFLPISAIIFLLSFAYLKKETNNMLLHR